MSRPINFTDTIVEKKPYVEINGTEYEVQDGTYNGGTDLNAETFNKMQDELDPFRNLLKIADGRYQHQGVIYEVENGTFRYISGTSDKEVNIYINIPPIKLKAGNYIMTNNSGNYPYLSLWNYDNRIATMVNSDKGIKTITINEETIIDHVGLYFGIDHYVPEVKLQLEEKQKTSYTPFVPQNIDTAINEKDLFRNALLQKNPKGYSTTINGITYKINDDYSINLNGTATSNSFIQLTKIFPLNGTYTISFGYSSSSSVYMRAMDVNDEYKIVLNTDGLPTNNINSEVVIFLYVSSGVTVNNVTVYPQIEKGVKETKYTPWVGYIVESGSNDDGSYIKYSDGTMICRYEKEVNVNINIALGSLYRSEGIAFPNFPIAFKKPPIISCYCKGDYSALICNWGKCTQNNPGPQIAIWPVSITSQTYIISYIAVGEWH